MVFYIPEIEKKLAAFDKAVDEALKLSERVFISGELGRDVQIVKTCDLPPKPKLSSVEGQARLVHDLASIELQAMELALRGLYEYPEAPPKFRQELAELARGEAGHLRLCLDCLKKLGYRWGDWPIHTALWQTVSIEDSLIERVFIVHRYLEASGLDAGDSILSRLSGVKEKTCLEVVSQIVHDEISHVEFGSRWFRILCEQENTDSEKEFARLYEKISLKAPRKEKMSQRLRKLAGFSEAEFKTISTPV